MTLLNVLQYPDPQLHKKARPVNFEQDDVQSLIDDMFETMYEQNGVGLAAVQVNVHKRVIVIDVSRERTQPLCLINPVITAREEQQISQEGCLSVPVIYDKVKRDKKIQVEAFDRKGKPFTFEASGLLSVCVQHEIDHLDGILFIQRLSNLKQSRARKKIEKLRRHIY